MLVVWKFTKLSIAKLCGCQQAAQRPEAVGADLVDVPRSLHCTCSTLYCNLQPPLRPQHLLLVTVLRSAQGQKHMLGWRLNHGLR